MKMSKIKPFLLLAAISFILIAANFGGNNNLEIKSTINSKSNIFNNPTIAGNHIPILIDGNGELATFVFDEGLSGDGTTYETSYIIENFTIDTSPEYGIEIRNTDAYVIIRNCTVLNTGTTNEEYSGIYIRSCSNITIINCTLDNNERAIVTDDDSLDITIINNKILNTNSIGIGISGFQKEILNNTLMYNDGPAIELYYSENNSVTGNIMIGNYGGISIAYSHNNTIFENEISGSFIGGGSGIDLIFSNENNITINRIINSHNGISLISSNESIIYFNDIYGNLGPQDFEDENCTDNQWDNGTTGNFWGNEYIIRYPDATNDGTVWDTPYEIDGVGLGIDNFPLVHSIFPDFEDPQFTDVPGDFSADEEYSGLNTSWIATDLHPATYTIELNGTELVSATTWISGTAILYNIPDGKFEGNYSITIIVLDRDGNSAQDTIIFTVNSKESKIPGFPLLNVLIFISVGVFLLRRKTNHRRIRS